MGHTYTSNLQHVVFSAKERRPLIPENLFPKLHAYFDGISRNLKITLIAGGGVADHVHLLMWIPSKLTVSESVQKLKANSSRWIREHGMDFAWQEGYGAFSVSPSQASVVKAYIANQKEHHKQRDSRAEFVALLEKCGIPFNRGIPYLEKNLDRLHSALLFTSEK
jgi:REP element-mobilizing transposase RayT